MVRIAKKKISCFLDYFLYAMQSQAFHEAYLRTSLNTIFFCDNIVSRYISYMFRISIRWLHVFLNENTLQIIPLVYSLKTTFIFRSSNAAGLFFELNLTFGAEGFLPYVFIFGFCRL